VTTAKVFSGWRTAADLSILRRSVSGLQHLAPSRGCKLAWIMARKLLATTPMRQKVESVLVLHKNRKIRAQISL
jgi:hypothetical protein